MTMKKTLLTLFVQLIAVCTMAQTDVYTGNLNVKMGIMTLANMSDVPLEMTKKENGNYSVVLRNFSIELLGSVFNVGNITIPDITAKESDNSISLESKPQGTENNIILSDGDDPNVDWLGPALGGVQGEVVGTLNGENLEMDIPLNVIINGKEVSLKINYNGKRTSSSGIDSVILDSDSSSDTVPYTLAGVPASSSYKGIVILNGKKIVRK